MNKSLFKLSEPFKYKWLIRKGLWRLIWWSFSCKWYVHWNDMEGFSIGLTEPYDKLWNNNYKVNFEGWILRKPLLYYTKCQN
jgi:hypothetical protein